MDYASICSGIECATAAFQPLGWRAVCYAEIDKFPRAVLRQHYPDVPLHGDFVDLIDDPPDADLLIAGTPCQDFSVAGLRAGLGGDRGNLTLQFIRLANAIDILRRARGKPPCVIVWENVPGTLSLGNVFGTFLGGLVGETSALQPTGGRWTDAGMVDGPERTAAWIIKDAQYFGLAQRRRRLFVVASARKGFDPGTILFEPEGVRRNSPPRRQTGQGTAPTITSRPTGGGGLGTDFDCDGGLIANTLQAADGRHMVRRDADNLIPHAAETVATLDASFGRLQGASGQDANHGHSHLIAFGGNNTSGPIDVATAVNAHGGPSGRIDFESETFITQAVDIGNGMLTEDLSGTLEAAQHKSNTGQGVMQAFKPSHFTRGKEGAPADVAPPLSADADKGDQDTLVFNARQDPLTYGDMAGPLDTDGHSMAVLAFSAKDSGHDVGHDLAPTMRGMSHVDGNANGGGQIAVAFESRVARNGRGGPSDVVPPLKAQSGESGKGDGAPLVAIAFDPNQITSVANRSNPKSGDPCHALPGQPNSPLLAFNITPSNSNKDYNARESDRAQAVTPKSGAPPSARGGDVIVSAWQVRRLMPIECERLQGLPDNYTLIPYRGKDAADGPRYKALGNGMPVPVIRWLGRRIERHIKGLPS